jgi:hypothetical protein
MQSVLKRAHFGLAALAAVGLLALVVPAAHAQKSKQIETEGEFVSFDAKAETVTIKVTKAGSGATPPRALKLENGKEAQFSVKTTGTVLTRTTVKLQDGTGGKFEDLKAGRKVKVFWLADDAGKTRLARSISVFIPAEEQGEDAGN